MNEARRIVLAMHDVASVCLCFFLSFSEFGFDCQFLHTDILEREVDLFLSEKFCMDC